jgi:hypothetical protein
VVTLYHGTSDARAATLLRNGWEPLSGSAGGQQGQTRFLYLTTTPENARWYAREKGSSRVLRVIVPRAYIALDPEDAASDSVDGELNLPSGLPGNFVLKTAVGGSAFADFDA